MLLDAARALADQVTARDLEEEAIYPPLGRIRDCSLAVACAVVRRAAREHLTDVRLGDDIEALVRAAMWVPRYRPIVFEPLEDAACASSR